MFQIISRIIFGLLCSLSLISGQLNAVTPVKKNWVFPCVKNETDYIIVGLGTAGTVLARYLSDPVHGKFKNSVLVLEAGQNRSKDPVITQGSAFLFNNFENLVFNPKYAFTKSVQDDNVPINGILANEIFSCGRMWFGTSAHNFMAANRGSSDAWDELASLVGNNQWKYNNLLPFFKALETFNGTTTTPNDRGFNGPLLVSQLPFLPTNSDPFPAAVASITGAPITSDFNVPAGNTAVTAGQEFSTPDFLTRSFAYAFLPTSILGSNGQGKNGRKLEVASGAFVNRVIFDGNKAIGVEYFLDNKVDRVQVAYARKQVILCAGVPFSAAILQRSGIGPKNILQQPEINIPVLVNNPLVGTGLKTHYGCLFAHTPPTTPFAAPFLSFSDGRNFFGPAGTGDNKRRFVVTWNGFPASLTFPLVLGLLDETPSTIQGTAGFAWNLRPRSSGTAYIVDANPFTVPDIRFNFYTDGDLSDPASDLSATVAMFKMINAIAAASGATMIYPPPSHFSNNQLLVEDAGGNLTYSVITVTNHYCGTCNMGTSKSNGVVSSKDLHVFGTKNLMVVDNSIYTIPPTANTGMSAYLSGIKAAKILGAPTP